jgi:hypothetical protein
MRGENPDGSPAVSQSLDGFSRNMKTPYVEQYNFTVETQLPAGWIQETGYIGSRGVKLLVEPSLNQALLVNSSSPMTVGRTIPFRFRNMRGRAVCESSRVGAPLSAAGRRRRKRTRARHNFQQAAFLLASPITPSSSRRG